MANFAAIVDPDPGRRAGFLASARRAVEIRPGLATGEVACGSFAVVWAAAPNAPVDVHRGSAGCGVVWGDAIGSPPARADEQTGGSDPVSGAGFLGAADFLRAWRGQRDPALAADGFHAALVVSEHGSLTVGCDLAGLFPIYHWSGPGGVLVVASSPEPFAHHPSFRPTLDVLGLAGVLLAGGSVGGRTLADGVRRLPAGHVLAYRPGRGATEIAGSRIPVSGDDPLRRAETADALDDALARAVRRQIRPGRSHALLLSGGRDSRLLAGHASRLGVPFRALTLGRRSDHEARCAGAVARALRVGRAVDEVPMPRFAECARLHARFEHLMGNASGLPTWGIGDLVDEDAVITGYDLELACGGIHLAWSAGTNGVPSWSGLRRTIAEHALAPDAVDGLARDPRLRDAIREIEEELERRYRAYGDDPEAGARGFIWDHWARCHPGAIPWRISFSSWPVVPVLDRELLALGARIPAEVAVGRGLQDAVLARHHPKLARAPLVRTSGTHEPIEPGPGWVVARSIERLRSELRDRVPRGGRPPPERRYYRRMYDLDNVGWVGVRAAAEPYRARLHDLFDETALAAFVPPPGRPLALTRPIADGYGRKTLIGLMLWMGRSDAGGTR